MPDRLRHMLGFVSTGIIVVVSVAVGLMALLIALKLYKGTGLITL